MVIDTEKIKEWLYKANSLFNELENENLTFGMQGQDMNENEKIRYAEITGDLEDQIEYLANKLNLSILAYVEKAGLNFHRVTCQNELSHFLKDKESLLETGNYHVTGDNYSLFIEKCWLLLSPFKEFNDHSYESKQQEIGLSYLEHILNNTSVIIKSRNVIPTSETEVYNEVKIVISSTFPEFKHPTEAFQKSAKCYKPDILIPSLSCAVEYKYANDEKTLIKTIDEILIDVQGYSKNRVYKIFYAVFYVKSGIWGPGKFKVVWDEKEFPDNWKGIIVFF